MKKIVAVFAVVLLSLGMFSCTADSTAQDDSLYNTQACDTCDTPPPTKGG